MAKRRPKLQFKIVLDTNAIWARGESYLLSREMSELVDTNRGDAHLVIEWILPEVVLNERIYQMQREAVALLPGLTRLERVIGHPMNITEEIISTRISETVDRQVRGHQLIVRSVFYEKIDWIRFVKDAVARRPPFEAKTEKGFRDAIIAETFIQLVEESPEQPQRCRLVLLTNDSLLSEAVKSRVYSSNNVQIFSTADQLKGLINTLMSTVPEDYVARLQAKAEDFFNDTKTKAGLFYDMEIRDAVQTQYKNQLEAKPVGADWRSNGTWQIAPPRFLKKDGQRVFWASRLSIAASIYKESPQQPLAYEHFFPRSLLTGNETMYGLGKLPTPGENLSIGSSTKLVGSLVPTLVYGGGSAYGAPVVPQMTSVNINTFAGEQRLTATGKTIIEVNWSVSVNIKGVFSKSKIDSIEFIETIWENVI
jgi:hypothetical protein